jgi:hypothetical protein
LEWVVLPEFTQVAQHMIDVLGLVGELPVQGVKFEPLCLYETHCLDYFLLHSYGRKGQL